MRQKICFYMGYTPTFNGQNYHNKKVYGSEITSIKLAEMLSSIYDVYMFVNGLDTYEEILCNGVQYLHTDKLHTFENIEIMIVVRYINYFIYFKNIAKKTFIWLHDVTVQPSYMGQILHSNGDNLLYNLENSFNKFIVLSDYHLNNNLNYIGLPLSKYTVIPNIIDTTYYKDNIPIVKNSFIYMSDISRGFDILLNCLIYIQNIVDISLTVFRKDEFTEEIKTKLKLLKNVKIYGKESQETIANECLRSEYFFYPTNFCETFCNCAAEAQLYKTVCIYNNVGSLNTTIGDRGLQINYSINDSNYIENTCKKILELMNNTIKKQDYINRGHIWAKNLHIDCIKNYWLNLFN